MKLIKVLSCINPSVAISDSIEYQKVALKKIMESLRKNKKIVARSKEV